MEKQIQKRLGTNKNCGAIIARPPQPPTKRFP